MNEGREEEREEEGDLQVSSSGSPLLGGENRYCAL
jgi:hypothetical protein